MEKSSPDHSGETGTENTDEIVKSKNASSEGRGLENDPELDELLDSSLADFGKHVPSSMPPSQVEETGKNEFLSLFDGFGKSSDNSTGREDEEDQLMKEMEEVFGEEFTKQAEAQLNEAMKMLESENPELMRQFEELAKTVGMEDEEESQSTSNKPPHRLRLGLEEQSPGNGSDHTLQSAVEDTLRRIQESSQGVPSSADVEGIEGLSSKLTDMMGSLDIGENGEGEEQVLKMMEDMMSTLLSKDVLYPSLVDFCKQYPEWLERNKDTLSTEDKGRYSNQLRIMQLICAEFEKGDNDDQNKERQETILRLMQELQQYGQPPEDLGGMPLSQMGFPSSLLPSPTGDNQCTLM